MSWSLLDVGVVYIGPAVAGASGAVARAPRRPPRDYVVHTASPTREQPSPIGMILADHPL